ncbi:MAG: hypothetical protein M0C28_00150 [Candidatus Moduliflexus flocculans]|nr:hypothetical protein [Candidatus Moduliflexus flocculans]
MSPRAIPRKRFPPWRRKPATSVPHSARTRTALPASSSSAATSSRRRTGVRLIFRSTAQPAAIIRATATLRRVSPAIDLGRRLLAVPR